MATPLLQTKLYIPPLRPDAQRVPRSRLVERLEEGLRQGRKLTLISAPAGFGKTTLLSEWIGQSEPKLRVAWLSLDGGDNDLTRFLTYLVAALQTVEGNVGQGLLAAIQSPGAVNVEAVLTTLINETTNLSDGLILVFDDYHVIESQAVDQALTFLLDHLPSPPGGMHLVIASRTDPTLPLSRLRARGHLVLFCADRVGGTFAGTNANIAVHNAALAAETLGLGCFYTGFVVHVSERDDSIARYVGLPETHQIYGALAMGYPRLKYKKWPERNPAKVTWLEAA